MTFLFILNVPPVQIAALPRAPINTHVKCEANKTNTSRDMRSTYRQTDICGISRYENRTHRRIGAGLHKDVVPALYISSSSLLICPLLFFPHVFFCRTKLPACPASWMMSERLAWHLVERNTIKKNTQTQSHTLLESSTKSVMPRKR